MMGRQLEQNRDCCSGLCSSFTRWCGFKAGDEVTIIGTKSAAGIIPSRIFGGDRQALEQSFAYRVSGLRLVGGIFALVGIGLLIISIERGFRS